MSDDRRLEDLGATTRRVYRMMKRSGEPLRITEIQKDLGLSTPSLAQYHVNKLLELGLVRQEGPGYVVERGPVNAGLLIKNRTITLHMSYSIFLSVTLVALLVLGGQGPLSSFKFLAVTVNAMALAFSIYEVVRTLRDLP